jgi:hypothetical protein
VEPTENLWAEGRCRVPSTTEEHHRRYDGHPDDESIDEDAPVNPLVGLAVQPDLSGEGRHSGRSDALVLPRWRLGGNDLRSLEVLERGLGADPKKWSAAARPKSPGWGQSANRRKG